jgi:pimeloyl-ACP methyl ester carboxylesterase
LLFVVQEQMLFFPQDIDAGRMAQLSRRPGSSQLAVRTASGAVQVFLQEPEVPTSACLLYFGGNAEETSWILDEARSLGARKLAAVNYPGYGRSEGRPGRATIEPTALAAFDALRARNCTVMDVMGRSLGSGVAVYVASQRSVRRMVLISPYDSVAAVARRTIWWAPIGLLLRHDFDSAARGRAIRRPLLIVAATDDRTIPFAHSLALERAWAGPTELVRIEHGNHETVLDDPATWRRMRAFLDR